jgi:hypothetical protein
MRLYNVGEIDPRKWVMENLQRVAELLPIIKDNFMVSTKDKWYVYQQKKYSTIAFKTL